MTMPPYRQVALLAALALALSLGTLASAQGSGSNPPARPSAAPTSPGSASMPAATRSAAPAAAPDLIAVAFVADWCPGCKTMKPKLAAARKEAADAACLFVDVDQTDRQSPQGAFLLAALGLGELWEENAGKTGFVLLVDPGSGRVVGRLTPDQDTRQMVTTIRRLAS
jgi:thiol:disulfide interchange protein